MATPAVDETEIEKFAEKAIGDLAGLFTVVLCHVGDRLGLFTELSEGGPASAAELARRRSIDGRYAAEWLRGLTAAGYLRYDEASGRYELSPEHAMVLAVEGGPAFLGGEYQMVGGLLEPIADLGRVFREGGGVRQGAYGPDFWEGMERFTAGWFENFLLQEWIPGMPEVAERLAAGCDYADVGCGSGRALIKVAEAYPNSRFVGYDLFEPQVQRARAAVAAAGLSGRIRVECADAVDGLPDRFDVISTFDVIHDAVDPLGLLRGVRRALHPDGIYICLDINCADRHEDNEGPLATVFYGLSVAYCMTTSLSAGGAGLGTCGLPEAKVQELCTQAGFASVRRVPLENPFNNLYEVRQS
ncbi:class I SAM-dependent methyltransferase [Nocardia carnea]|uniref:Methyltransferase domain-containing protein n=1 Tax=Nocardia carnea TaxID=37328 RepID=A0ABW7TVG3_9NOCA|nr:methyltransferase domain-containing protein [Nocardia carnea]